MNKKKFYIKFDLIELWGSLYFNLIVLQYIDYYSFIIIFHLLLSIIIHLFFVFDYRKKTNFIFKNQFIISINYLLRCNFNSTPKYLPLSNNLLTNLIWNEKSSIIFRKSNYTYKLKKNYVIPMKRIRLTYFINDKYFILFIQYKN